MGWRSSQIQKERQTRTRTRAAAQRARICLGPTSANAWEEMFGRLVAYKQQHGDCLVPRNYSDKQLAKWVNIQRMSKNKGKLEPARVQRLNELGFVWDAIGESWEEMFGRLVAYKQKHGDCLVPRSYSDKQLATWVDTQRVSKIRANSNPHASNGSKSWDLSGTHSANTGKKCLAGWSPTSRNTATAWCQEATATNN